MKRPGVWIGIGGILLLGTGVWLTRLWWLPGVLRWALEGLPLDRLRYEAATWEGLRITLYRAVLSKGSWYLTADSVSLRLGWHPSLQLGNARFYREKDLGQTTPAQAPSLFTSPLKLLQKTLRQMERLDTISIPSLLLSEHIAIAFYKRGDSLIFISRYDTLELVLHGKGKGNSYAWRILPVSFSGKHTAFAWQEVKGKLSWREDTLIFSVIADEVFFYHPRLSVQRLCYERVGAIVSAAYRRPRWYVQLVPEALPLQFTVTAEGYGSDSFSVSLHVPAQSFSAYQGAFPWGFFSVLGQARFAGSSALDLRFTYNPTLPDTLDLQVSWQTEGFRILSWPPPNPLLLREPFTYRPWRSTRTIRLGPENPDYLTYHQIHPYVLFAILHSEDGGFFYHKGFQKEFFLRALLENWRCKCFRRGAGTITMQLVRNLLLSRQKTLARKVEEICLTALIERFRLLSKERMLELYLNMVEWGPEVYGLTEASRFYFAKSPYDLTLSEAIFLGTILPSPKNYRYFIEDSTHCAKSSLEPIFKRICYFVSKANFVPEDSIQVVSPSQVCLRGPALRVFLPPDSLEEE